MDWIKQGWGENFLKSYDGVERYRFDLSGAKYNGFTTMYTVMQSVSMIVDTMPGPYTLLVSGGVDSQAMILSWLTTGKKFNIVSFIYTDGVNTMNQHDLDALKKFSAMFSLDVVYIEINIIHFLENELIDFAKRYQCTSPHICTHMKMVEIIDSGTCIFSGNALYSTGPMVDYAILGLYRYSVNSNRSVVPFFFINDPFIAMAFAHSEMVLSKQEFIDDPYDRKCAIYRHAGFEIIQQEQKFSGFEMIKNYYDTKHGVTMRERIRYANMPSARNFDIMFRYRLRDVVEYNHDIIKIMPKFA